MFRRRILQAFLITGLLVPQARSGEAAEFKLTYNSDWPPFSHGVGTAVKGILPDLMEEIVGKRMGQPVRHSGHAWKRVQKFVEIGREDAMVTAPTVPRLKYARTSENIVYTLEFKAVAARGGVAAERIRTAPEPSALTTLRVCDIVGNGWAERFYGKIGVKYMKASKVGACLRMIAGNRVDVTLQPAAVASRAITANNLGDRLTILPALYSEAAFTLLLSKKSAFGVKFLEKFDAALTAMKADGSYSALITRLKGG